ncbi:hypothetical protein pclt_cds_717 [Pandoravirus celtis]|uniref:Uncharacterized protein n=1 Tax=Pandoravirus celtis TaxID=2568002 RepID=A0A4D6EHX5_9VIRU|nr:hypothetical protein pclt_cds_717 [Pandoravirus celtis]
MPEPRDVVRARLPPTGADGATTTRTARAERHLPMDWCTRQLEEWTPSRPRGARRWRRARVVSRRLRRARANLRVPQREHPQVLLRRLRRVRPSPNGAMTAKLSRVPTEIGPTAATWKPRHSGARGPNV